MKELQGHAEQLQWENDQLRAQIEKIRDLGKYVRDGSRVAYPITRNKGKEPVIPDDVDTPTDDELSLGSSPSLSLSSTMNTRESAKAKSRKRPSHHLAFSNAVSGASLRARKERSRGAEPASSCPWKCVNIAQRCDATGIDCRHDATNTFRTSCLWSKASVLHAANSLNSQTQ